MQPSKHDREDQAPSPASHDRPRRGWVRPLLAVVFLPLAGWLLWRELRRLSWTAFVAALAATPPSSVALSIGLTLASYACLAASEWLALQALGHRLSYRQAAMVAVPAYALTNSAGFSPATGTLFRLQLYARKGLDSAASTAVSLLAGTAVTLSGLVTAGAMILLDAPDLAIEAHTPGWTVVGLGLLLLTPAGLWFVAFAPAAPAWLGGGRGLRLTPRVRAAGLAAGIGDWLTSGAALYVLLPDPALAILPGFLAAFIAGSLVSAATGVPGGLGVFEAIVLALTAVLSQVHETAAALLLYRCIYSLGPLGIWSLVAAVRAWRRRRLSRRRESGEPAG